MSDNKISKEVKDFVFHSIDSVEQLDILLLLQSDVQKKWSIKEISNFLRSTPTSIKKRVSKLIEQNLLLEASDPGEKIYSLHFQSEAVLNIVSELAEIYKTHRYGILEIIFSPLKKSRDFADAFKISSSKDPKGGRHG